MVVVVELMLFVRGGCGLGGMMVGTVGVTVVVAVVVAVEVVVDVDVTMLVVVCVVLVLEWSLSAPV